MVQDPGRDIADGENRQEVAAADFAYRWPRCPISPCLVDLDPVAGAPLPVRLPRPLVGGGRAVAAQHLAALPAARRIRSPSVPPSASHMWAYVWRNWCGWSLGRPAVAPRRRRTSKSPAGERCALISRIPHKSPVNPRIWLCRSERDNWLSAQNRPAGGGWSPSGRRPTHAIADRCRGGPSGRRARRRAPCVASGRVPSLISPPAAGSTAVRTPSGCRARGRRDASPHYRTSSQGRTMGLTLSVFELHSAERAGGGAAIGRWGARDEGTQRPEFRGRAPAPRRCGWSGAAMSPSRRRGGLPSTTVVEVCRLSAAACGQARRRPGPERRPEVGDRAPTR